MAARKQLIAHAQAGLSEYDFRRKGVSGGDHILGFTTLEEFKEDQAKIVAFLDLVEVKMYLALLAKSIRLMDKESYVAFPMSGVCFKKDGTPVFFNERSGRSASREEV